MEQERGWLLAYTKHGDHNAVLHCFTLKNGYNSYFIKGIFAPKNRKKAFIQPLREIEFLVRNSSNSALKSIHNIELAPNAFQDWNTDFKLGAIVFFVSDFLNQILRHENSNPELYEEIRALQSQFQNKNYACHLVFLHRLLQIQGLQPLYSTNPFLDPETAQFIPTQAHSVFNQSVSELWQTLSLAKEPYATIIPSKERAFFLDSLLIYYHYHFGNFRSPNSLEVLKQLF
ncbi:DNA repair protein RecO [Bergeyella sp. RCAD1439]|uniref:DNA repair protein RecO n=1 Tax=Bergeyella anatis TaxID=3113737 RepID=UPI002E18A952|nr:recombination protein O N-terminal domain-containing protein [Bergeyella sp. RCAD1439]